MASSSVIIPWGLPWDDQIQFPVEMHLTCKTDVHDYTLMMLLTL